MFESKTARLFTRKSLRPRVSCNVQEIIRQTPHLMPSVHTDASSIPRRTIIITSSHYMSTHRDFSTLAQTDGQKQILCLLGRFCNNSWLDWLIVRRSGVLASYWTQRPHPLPPPLPPPCDGCCRTNIAILVRRVPLVASMWLLAFFRQGFAFLVLCYPYSARVRTRPVCVVLGRRKVERRDGRAR